MDQKKQTIAIAVLGVLLVGSTLYLNFFPQTKKEEKTSTDLVSVFSQSNEKKTGLLDSSDGSGVPNWKQAVLKEAKANDPDGKLTSDVADADQTNLNDPNNITAQYAKNVYAAIAVLEQKQTLTDKQKTDISKAIFEQEAAKAQAKVWEIKSLTTFTASKADIKKYGNSLADLVSKAIIEGGQYDDLTLAENYGKTGDKKSLLQLDKKIAIVTKFRDDILKMRVPLTAGLYHLRALNSVEGYRQTLINIRSADTDALRATLGMHDYVTVYQTMFTNIDALSQYFDRENIVFTSNEIGFIFTKGLISPQ